MYNNDSLNFIEYYLLVNELKMKQQYIFPDLSDYA